MSYKVYIYCCTKYIIILPAKQNVNKRQALLLWLLDTHRTLSSKQPDWISIQYRTLPIELATLSVEDTWNYMTKL